MIDTDTAVQQHHLRPLLLPTSQQTSLRLSHDLLEAQGRHRRLSQVAAIASSADSSPPASTATPRSSIGNRAGSIASSVASPCRSTFDDSASVSTAATVPPPSPSAATRIGFKKPDLMAQHPHRFGELSHAEYSRPITMQRVSVPIDEDHGARPKRDERRRSYVDPEADQMFLDPPSRSSLAHGSPRVGNPSAFEDERDDCDPLQARHTRVLRQSRRDKAYDCYLDPYASGLYPTTGTSTDPLGLPASYVEEYRRRDARSTSRDTDSRLAGEPAWDDQSNVDALEWNRAAMYASDASDEIDDDPVAEPNRSSSDTQDTTPKPQQPRHAPSAWSLHAGKLRRSSSRLSQAPSVPTSSDPCSQHAGKKTSAETRLETGSSDDYEVAALRRQVEQLQMALLQKGAGGDRPASHSAELAREQQSEAHLLRPPPPPPSLSTSSTPSRRTEDRRMVPAPKPRPSEPLPHIPPPYDPRRPPSSGPVGAGLPTDTSVERNRASADYHRHEPHGQPQLLDGYYDPARHRLVPSPSRERLSRQYLEAYYASLQVSTASGREGPFGLAEPQLHLHRTPSLGFRNGGPTSYEYRHGMPRTGPPSSSTAWPDESVSQVGSEESRRMDELAKKVEKLEALLQLSAAVHGAAPHGGGLAAPPEAGKPPALPPQQAGETHARTSQSTDASGPTDPDRRSLAFRLANASSTSQPAASPAASAFNYNATRSLAAISALDLSDPSPGSNASRPNLGTRKKSRTISSVLQKLAPVGGGSTGTEETRSAAVSWSRKRMEKEEVPRVKLKQGPGRGRTYIAPSSKA